jgi:hypothetical protein
LQIRAKKTTNQTKIKLHISGARYKFSGAMATGRPIFVYPCSELFSNVTDLIWSKVGNRLNIWSAKKISLISIPRKSSPPEL